MLFLFDLGSPGVFPTSALCVFLIHTRVFTKDGCHVMTRLSDITYSQEATVEAVRDYYTFLTRMYLDDHLVKEPPEGGWPGITAESMRGLGKTDQVISLLRHLPYIDSPGYDGGPNALPNCTFADWHRRAEEDAFLVGSADAACARSCSEGAGICEAVPPHVVGLTWDSEDRYPFLLDTKLGVIYWVDCDYDLRRNSCRERVWDCAYDYAPEKEADAFRGDSGTWAVGDFFEVLKEQYRKLRFLPRNSTRVCDVKDGEYPDEEGRNELIASIYRRHGWPDLQIYRKDTCLEAIRRALAEHNYSDDRF
ncbi:uncharacterized protein MAM_01767 [Metarhizium album ARSEF 1941]|uniref:Uncharacterized protein n=1 Tax=Metarhizium album (strain ARSEF 1941) TaxID=1081103 RepID=A0A0B2X3R3_METAS|nr:uncharacterized protein MAM_01767 [Metarhizium album ARSEF 1941]KHO00989.1 hypothetical protein MAM_01767 [Metarhizium album ARSEF 1941]